MKKRMVIDVESVGLHGEGFAVAYVLLVGDEIIAEGCAYCPHQAAAGAQDDRKWVAANVTMPVIGQLLGSPREVRQWFWDRWMDQRTRGPVELWADCSWPVETNFLSACVADEAGRTWGGPYPLHDVATLMMAGGRDPLGTYHRGEEELPAHNPLADARQSARHLLEVLASPKIGHPAHRARKLRPRAGGGPMILLNDCARDVVEQVISDRLCCDQTFADWWMPIDRYRKDEVIDEVIDEMAASVRKALQRNAAQP